MVGDVTTTAATGAGETFDEFYAERFTPLSKLAFLLTGSAAQADELAQDACEQVLRRWDEIDHPRTYARLAVVNGSRSKGRRLRLAERTPGDARPHAEVDTDALAVREVLAGLAQREREVVVLRFYADMKLVDIADELDTPLGTVKSLLHRALARMRESFTEGDASAERRVDDAPEAATRRRRPDDHSASTRRRSPDGRAESAATGASNEEDDR